MLALDRVVGHARPDLDLRQAAAARIAGLREQRASAARVVAGRGQRGIEAERARRDHPARRRVPAEVDLLDDRLAIDGGEDRLANAAVVERLDPSVEAVEPHAELRTPYVDVTAAHHGPAVVARRWRRVLELALLEFLVHVVELAAREDPVDETREPRRTVEVGGVRRQDDLSPALPALEAERAGADGPEAEGHRVALGDVTRHDLGLADGEHGDERERRLGERDLHGVTVERLEADHAGRLPAAELGGAADVAEEVGRPRFQARVEQARQRVHDVVGRDLAAVVEVNTLAQGERPREPVARGAPELGERRSDGQRLIERHETVEDLLRDRPAVDVVDERGIERGGIVADRPPVDALLGERLTGGREQTDECEERDARAPRPRRQCMPETD